MQLKQKSNINLKKSVLRFNLIITIFCFIIIFLLNNAKSEARIRTEILTIDSLYYKFTLIDGTNLTAKVLEYDYTSITLTNQSIAKLTLLLDKIKSIDDVKNQNPEAIFSLYNRSANRYFISPSAIPMQKGDVDFQKAYLFANMLNFGITDNFSLLVGTEFLTLLYLGTPYVYVAPKLGFEIKENVHLGVGAFRIQSLSFNQNIDNFSALYGMATYGNSYRNVTVNLGLAKSDNNNSLYVFTGISSMLKIYNKLSIVGEIWAAPSSANINNFMLGLRVDMDNVSIDLGYLNNNFITLSTHYGYPYVSCVVFF